jgi:3-methyladenine DNA glycosylase AlkD
MPSTAAAVRRELASIADPTIAAFVQGYFRTGKGEYAEGDRFRGIKVPAVRNVARAHRDLPLPEIGKLLASAFHEDRMLALIILADRAQRAEPAAARGLCEFYLRHRAGVNNWDLVDLSAHLLLGPFVQAKRSTIDRLASSPNVWDRRIAILAHMHAIRLGETKGFFLFAQRFLEDDHDLIHKAVGWLLREAGKRDPEGLHRFLRRHGKRMPRTMLRYAIERLSAEQRRSYLAR